MSQENTLKNNVLSWLKNTALTTHGVELDIDLDMDLFESGLLTSLTFIQLLLVIEDAIGREVIVDGDLVDKVKTVRSICENFDEAGTLA